VTSLNLDAKLTSTRYAFHETMSPMGASLSNGSSNSNSDLSVPLHAEAHIYYAGARATMLDEAAAQLDEELLGSLIIEDMAALHVCPARWQSISWTPTPDAHAIVKWTINTQESVSRR
jgi:hypothetical protein